MDAFERFARSGMELNGLPLDDMELLVMRGVDAVYGDAMRRLAEADLVHEWPETDLDPRRAPTGSPAVARPQAPRAGDADEPAEHAHDHLQDLPLRDQARLVASGELDAAELLRATLERIAERDGPLNSVVATFPEEAERQLAQAPDGPLRGVPVAVKDQFALPWRAPRDGTARDALPAGDSGVARRLRDAGALVPAVTNMHYWGAGSTGHISAYGPCGNPWNVEHCGGGSSGGSAAAVGARLVAGAVGADGGGSIRLPAAYCGITGLKPTFGSVPVDGNVHGHLSMDTTGPMCRDAADARLLGSVLCGRDLPAGDGAGLRAGIVRAPFWEDLDPEVEAACLAAVAAAGWQTEELSLAGAEHAPITAAIRLTNESAASLEPGDLDDADPLLRALAKYQLLIPAHLIARADRVRSMLRRASAEAFGRVDLLVWPTVPAPAPRIDNPTVALPSGLVAADAANVRQAGFGNLTGLPGASVPVGLHSSGLPIGLMIQAAWGADAIVLDAAEHLERATGREFVDAAPTLTAA